MPPAVSRFAPQNLSNPFNHLNNHHSLQQNSHLQHSNHNIQSQNLSGHPGFGGGNPGLFTPSTGNGAIPGAFGGGGGLGGGGTGLASHAAQMGFAHGAQLQQEQAREAAGLAQTKGLGGRIREVWRGNLEAEMRNLRQLVDKYPYVSMDTEFPGIVARPMGEFQTKASYHYQTVRCNVDLLKLIQLGITLFDVEGELPPAQPDSKTLTRASYHNNLIMCPCTWTFNFQFSLEKDMYNSDYISVLTKTGADFEKHASQGIDPLEFGSLLITSGLTLSENVHWISFHSGYDFAHLVKLMWAQQLPADEEEYRRLVQIFFPRIIDVKFLLRHAQKLATRSALSAPATAIINALGTQKSGLQDLADELACARQGTQHHSGSDAWLTGLVFFAMRDKIFDGDIPDELTGQMWGLTGVGAPASAAIQQAVLAAQGQVNGQAAQGQQAQGFHGAGAQFRDGPSTPTTGHAGLERTTPGPGMAGLGPSVGSMTPGGGGGVFGNFQYAK
ncbi:ribonuclease H-like protein [Patellaria atrata CBS 101060]|uniref:poly(A)-specific ribonuclease n=1 Tax=Patellaria atrata CBS 101060 TaxID=1346257 RepID=A0A9P4SEX6_9PEZI|nr:ribonuclease H-like protein [Patellaria atrata CBS 101060]